MLRHVPGRGLDDLRVIQEKPDAHIAAMAQQPADLAGHMIVVNMPAFTLAARGGRLAHRAAVPLALDEAVPASLGQPVRTQCPGTFPELRIRARVLPAG